MLMELKLNELAPSCYCLRRGGGRTNGSEIETERTCSSMPLLNYLSAEAEDIELYAANITRLKRSIKKRII